jgi:hypothetical protein
MLTATQKMKENRDKATSANERFGAMAALPRRQFCGKFGSYSPAASSVEAATAPSCASR